MHGKGGGGGKRVGKADGGKGRDRKRGKGWILHIPQAQAQPA